MIVPARTQDERMVLVAYLASKIGVTPERMVGHAPFEVVAVTRRGKPVGAILYINKRSHTIEMSWAGEPGWLTRGDIRNMWAYPFQQLGCLTVTGTIHCRNQRSIELALRLGCKRIGVVPHAFGIDEDGILFCMKYDDCPWVDAPSARHAHQMMNGEMHVR